MTRVFISGLSGFIGSHLASHLRNKSYEVAGLVHSIPPSWNTNLINLVAGCQILLGDIKDFQAIKSFIVRWSPQYVVHLAAASIVKTAYLDPVGTFDVNVMGTVKLLQACKHTGVKRILVNSTDKVYGNQENATISSPLIPTEIYSASKIGADVAASRFQGVVVTRMCNVYGGGDPNDRIIPNTIRACLRGKPPVVYKNDMTLRQYIYVQDAVEAIEFALEKGEAKFYNVAPQAELMNSVFNQEQVVKEVLKHFPGLEPDYRDRPGTYAEIARQSMICNMDGWQARWTFEDGIKQTVEDFKRALQPAITYTGPIGDDYSRVGRVF